MIFMILKRIKIQNDKKFEIYFKGEIKLDILVDFLLIILVTFQIKSIKKYINNVNR